MTGSAFDSNIIIDALTGYQPALDEIRGAADDASRVWVSRMVWIEVLSKGTRAELAAAERFLTGFIIDELDADIAIRASALRRERPRLKSPDAVILASAQVRGRTLVTRNTKDFPADMPGVRNPYTL